MFITALNDWTKDKQFRGLQKKLDSDSRFSVLRDGELHELPLAELVVGDVAQFKYGNTFPVDGILVQVGWAEWVELDWLTVIKCHADKG